MQMFWITASGLVLTALGFWLVRRFGDRAKREGIGTFSLLPLVGIVYVIGLLCIIVGTVFILLGLSGMSCII